MFVVSLTVGVLMGSSYDLLRIIRRFIPHKILSINIEDIAYWALWTYFLICILQKYNKGELRFYIVAGIIIGVIIYKYTIGCALIKATNYISKHVRELCRKIWNNNKKTNKTLKNERKKSKIKLSITKLSKDRW